MIIICCVCKRVVGEKEPLEDKQETHGYCEPCFESEKKKIAFKKNVAARNDVYVSNWFRRMGDA